MKVEDICGAGLDVHKRIVVACVLKGALGEEEAQIAELNVYIQGLFQTVVYAAGERCAIIPALTYENFTVHLRRRPDQLWKRLHRRHSGR